MLKWNKEAYNTFVRKVTCLSSKVLIMLQFPNPIPPFLISSHPSSAFPTAALLPVGVLTSRNSRVLEEQAAVLEAQREAQLEAQRQAQREAQREAQLERERDMERQRLRELQLAQYCGCAKCQVRLRQRVGGNEYLSVTNVLCILLNMIIQASSECQNNLYIWVNINKKNSKTHRKAVEV